MMYDPNYFTLNIQQIMSGEPLDAAVGVLQVTIHSARGLRGARIGTPDPYVSLSISQRAELAKTKYKLNTYVYALAVCNSADDWMQDQSNMGGDQVHSRQQSGRATYSNGFRLQ